MRELTKQDAIDIVVNYILSGAKLLYKEYVGLHVYDVIPEAEMLAEDEAEILFEPLDVEVENILDKLIEDVKTWRV